MENFETQIARRYHQKTKHSLISVQSSRHYLDWDNQPRVYKTYRSVESISLPIDLPETGQRAMDALLVYPGEEKAERIPDIAQLAYLLYYTAGVTKVLRYPGGEIKFRAAAAAGALYPIEVYAVCGDLPGLPAGVYHFGPRDFSLRVLRRGNYRKYLGKTSGSDVDVDHAPLVLIFSAITWRSAWKYQARSYRYHFWDGGTMLANCLAACQALDLPARVVLGFADQQVDQLVGIDGKFEKSLALLPVGRSVQAILPTLEVSELNLEIEPYSNEWRAYPIIDELHGASNLEDPRAVEKWRAHSQGTPTTAGERDDNDVPAGDRFPLQPYDQIRNRQKSLEATILKRGSSRRFHREALPANEFSAILAAAASGFPRDWDGKGRPLLNRMFINVHAIEGIPPGSYLFLPEAHELVLLQEGDFRAQSAYLCLGQELAGDASATVFFLADLESTLRRHGNRGYRVVQLEAGILGGKMYLAAYAFGRGASGLTFFDDDVVSFFSPEAQGMETIFVTALGVPAPSSRRTGKMVYLSPGRR